MIRMRETRILGLNTLPLWAMLTLHSLALGDVVRTRAGRLEGAARFREGRIEIGGKPIAWDDLLFVIREPKGRPPSARSAVRLTTGERWRADLLGLSGKTLSVRLPLFGERQLDLGRLATLDFIACPEPANGLKAGTLYRDKGEPIPGKLLWLDARQVAIDSPLGVLELPRASAVRYVVGHASAPAPATGEDEVLLADGSLLRGRATPGSDTLALEHATLGKLSFPSHVVAAVVRHPAGVHYLAEVQPDEIARAPLLVLPSSVARVGLLNAGWEHPARADAGWGHPAYSHDAGGHGIPACLKGWRVEPKASLRYRLPKGAGGKRMLRCGLEPLAGSKGSIRLRVVAGDRVLFDKELQPESAWPALDLTIPDGDGLTIEVDFGAKIRFPCGVVLCDPHVVEGKRRDG